MCRQRGRIVLVGVTGLELNRADFYKKEISFQVSCSYGPGRYDEVYESRGIDYPFGLVRWTEQRNFQAVLQLMESAQLDVRPLISHRFAFGAGGAAYDLLADRAQPSLGIVLDYKAEAGATGYRAQDIVARAVRRISAGEPGGGVHRRRQLCRTRVDSGISSERRAPLRRGDGQRDQCGALWASIRIRVGVDRRRMRCLTAPEVDCRRDRDTPRHPRAIRAARARGRQACICRKAAGAHRFRHRRHRGGAFGVQFDSNSRTLMIGFNRRFAPLAIRMKALLGAVREPKSFIVTVNAGAAAAGHWTVEPAGGGRIIGEACHFIDFVAISCGVADHRQRRAPYRWRGCGVRRSFRMHYPEFCRWIAWNHSLLDGRSRILSEGTSRSICGRASVAVGQFPPIARFWLAGLQVATAVAAGQRSNRRARRPSLAPSRREMRSPIPLEEILEVSRATIAVSEAALH